MINGGLLHYLTGAELISGRRALSCDVLESSPDELGFASDAWFFVMDVGLVEADRDRPMPPNRFDRLAQKGPGGFRVPPCGQAKTNHLAIRIDRPPQVAPLAADTDIGFIHMPIDACAAQVFPGSLRQFRAKRLNPAIRCRSVDHHAARVQQIDNILGGERITQIY